eukprot:884626-Rhodomonas_salina.1
MPPKRRRSKEDPVQPAGRRQQSLPGQGHASHCKHNEVSASLSHSVLRSGRRSASEGKSGRGGCGEKGEKVDWEAEGEVVCSSGMCCCCGTDLAGSVHVVSSCLHTFCCACLLERATANKPSVDGDYCCGECGQEIQAFTLTGGG